MSGDKTHPTWNRAARFGATCACAAAALLGLWGCADTPSDPGGEGSNNAGQGTNNAATPNNNGGGNAVVPGNNGGDNAVVPGNNGGVPVDPLLPPQCAPSDEVCDGLDNDCNGQVDEIACACLVDTACYGGPAQTRGVGACRDGQRACDANGEFFGPCDGWGAPVEEACRDQIDNDCDGIVDEGACVEVCDPGTSRVCYGGDPAQEGVGICAPGTQVCDVERRWGDCSGWVGPQQEVCDDGLDNDCDGVEDRDCYEDQPGLEETFVVSEVTERQPVDFVMVIDNSGSMDDTVSQVEANLGNFAQRMVSSGIDYRFILVAEKGTDPDEPDVCVPPPMGGAGCSDSLRFTHVNQVIDSHNAFEQLLRCLQGCGNGGGYRYSDKLRPNALKQIIVVTDDESNLPWFEFAPDYRQRVGDFILNGVVGLRGGGCVAEVGNQYIFGAEETGGELLHICDNDWGQVIDVLFEATISRLTTVFELSREPIPGSVRIFVQAPGLPEIELNNGWTYDPATRTVRFDESTQPQNGETVIIRYVPRG
jgi:hypothetical protein